jgi:ribosomal-protein-serine acetyltransferase
MNIYVDSNIQITPLVPAFTQRLFILTDTNRAHLKLWLSWLDLVETIADTQTFIETAIEQHNNNEASIFAVLYQNELVGLAGFNHFDHQHNWGAIGYWLSESHLGRGIISSVVKKLLEFGFNEHQLHKIEIRCAEHNSSSRAIPERLGFTYEATLRECEWLYDHYVSHAVYTLLRTEYKANTPL